MQILVADGFEASGLEALKADGCEVFYEPALAGEGLVRAIGSSGADVLVVQVVKI